MQGGIMNSFIFDIDGTLCPIKKMMKNMKI